MQLDLYPLLKDDAQLLLFVLLALGYLLGNVKIGGFKLGSASGVLIAGLIFGHFQFDLDPAWGDPIPPLAECHRRPVGSGGN